jgi:hypothetical protein
MVYMSKKSKPIRELFDARVRVVESGCHEWAGYVMKNGYGTLCVGKKAAKESGSHKSTLFLAHRLAWELANGPVPDGMMVLHRCDNRKCCNPEHLFLGTAKDNYDDMVTKGRRVIDSGGGRKYAKGEGHTRAKLSTSDVLAIRSEANEGGNWEELAVRYGVTRANIRAIVIGLSWTHI